MAKTSKNILDEARSQIKSIDIDEARRMLEKPGTVLLDVREGDEWRQGHIPQAVGIPRGFLELRVEEKVPDHKTPVILQCASGTRSLLAPLRHSRGRREGPGQAARRQGATARSRCVGLVVVALPGRSRRGHAGTGRFRRSRSLQPAAPDNSYDR